VRKLLALLSTGPLLAISIVTFSLITASVVFTSANAAPNSIEINSISEVSCTSVEILFESSVPKKSLVNYVITAAVDPSVGQPKNIKKIIKTKATGLITAEIKNLNPKVAYKFSVSAKTNKGKMINSEAVEYYSLCDLMDTLSNLPADWGNPKPIPTPTPTPVAAPVAAVVYTVGQRGPGGGIVYYVSDNYFTSTGSTCNTECKYLEVAPATWQSAGVSVADDSFYQWSTNTTVLTGQDITTASTEGIAPNANEKLNWKIGRGFNNTSVMKVSGATSAAQAAVLAYAGTSIAGQWFIPSMNELNELCKYARGQTTGDLKVACTTGGTFKSTASAGTDLGGFVADRYWSSSGYDAPDAWVQFFDSGVQLNNIKPGTRYVRPVRAF
jgi:hypothetical protein